MEELKTILITSAGWFELRNLIRTDAFEILKSRKDLRIVIFAPSNLHDKILPSGHADNNVILEDLEMFELNMVEKMLLRMEDLIFFNINRTETVKIYELMRKKKDHAKYLSFELAKKVLGKNRNLIDALERLDMVLSKYKYKRFRYLFEKYNPSLLLSTNFMCRHDWALIKAAKLNNVPVVCMVANWDHLFKGRLPKCDRVIVWNDFQKKQLVNYYGYNPSDIFVSGIQHMDYFVREKSKFLPREEFLKLIGAPADKKLITFTTMSRSASPFQPDMIDIICKAIVNERIKNAHLHVRLHPSDKMENYERLKQFGDIITFEKSVGQNYLGEEDIRHYANLLACSDVVVNIASTVTLDALAFEVPVVNIAFDGYAKVDFPESTARYFRYEHYEVVAKSGGVRVANNAEELIKYINMYLDNRGLDKDARAKVVEELCYKLDGRTGERVGNYILNFLEERM